MAGRRRGRQSRAALVWNISIRGTLSGLWRMNADGTGAVQLDEGQATWPAQTRDGRTVIFTSSLTSSDVVMFSGLKR